MKRLLPRTLFGRALLILVTPIVLVQLIATFVFFDRHWDDLTRRLSLGLAGDIAMVVEDFQADPDPGFRGRLFERARRNMGLDFSWRPDAVLAEQPGPFQIKNLMLDGRLRRALGERIAYPTGIDTTTFEKRVTIDVQLPDGVLRAAASRKRLSSTTTGLFMMWMVGTAVILLAIAIVFLRNQLKPIQRLAEAADAYGRGHEVEPIKPAGALEVRRAARAFLTMRERIKRQMDQRTEMLAGVSHDLRTPLTRMKLQLAMLGNDREAGDLRSDVQEMENMIDEYLAFARGQDVEAAVEIDVLELLRDIVARARRRGMEVALADGEALPAVLRPGAMRRCLTNLVDNAARFGSRVEVEASRRDDHLAIAVDDDGPGIDPERREEVFRPFHRLESSRNPETGGSGLGLSIARDVARGHGGEVLLSQSPLGGLRAEVRLPD